MERIITSVLNDEDYRAFSELKDIIHRGNKNEDLLKLFESINDSLKNGIYPTTYIEEVKSILANKLQVMINYIKQLNNGYLEIISLNEKLRGIINSKESNNSFSLFENINHNIKDKNEEITEDEKIYVTYSLYDGNDYKAIVETNTNSLLRDIKRVLKTLSTTEINLANNENVTKYCNDTLFAAQVYYRFSEYIRYIDFTMYDKDINTLELYEKYKDIVLKIKDIVDVRTKYINDKKRIWKKSAIALNTENELLRKLYDDEKYCIFTKEEILDSIYPEGFIKNKEL